MAMEENVRPVGLLYDKVATLKLCCDVRVHTPKMNHVMQMNW